MSGLLLCRDDNLWHRPTARGDSWWRPIACGEGIVLPGPEYTPEQVAERGGELCGVCAPEEVAVDA